jgi:hypothetical protein
MLRLVWTYYAPGEVARAVEHIDVLVERGTAPGAAAKDAARIYRQRTGDYRTPFVRAHLATQWRVKRRGGPGLLPGQRRISWKPRPVKYPTEVSFRASFHRLVYE